ncbi:MAG TPA: hypothetical protein VGK59_15575 [Ohtaekwangia sp.]
MSKVYILTFSFCMTYVMVQAQDPKQWDGEGDLKPIEVIITTERQITLPSANRNFDKVPPRPVEATKPPFTYDFRSFSFQAPQVSLPVKPLKLKAQSKPTLYGGYLRAGYGNYASPLLEAYINSTRDKNKLYGARFHHRSSGKGPVDGKNSGSGSTGISVFGKSFSDDLALSGNLSYDNRTTHFYGYPSDAEVNEDSLKQSYKVFKLSGELTNAKNSDIAYRLGAGFSYLSDKFDARETEVNLLFNSSYDIDDETRIDLDAGYYGITRKDEAVEAKPRSLFTVSPSYSLLVMESIKLTVGLTAAFENDSIDSKSAHLYPNFRATYPVSPSVDLVASLTGGIEKVSLQSLSNENLWLAPNVPVFHTNKTFDLEVGLKARLGNKVSAQAGLSMANLKNWYSYVNLPEDPSKFTVAYDEGGVKRTNLYASLSYAQSELAKFMVRGDYFGYRADELSEVWHRPTYRLTAHGSYNLYQKMIFSADLIAQGGMKAFDPETGNDVKLDGAFDLNLKGEYLFSESFSAFVQLNNITSNEYPLFLNYPVRGFQLLAGITWSF